MAGDRAAGPGSELFLKGLIATQGISTAVPEPSTFALAALGLLGLGWYGRRRRKRAA